MLVLGLSAGLVGLADPAAAIGIELDAPEQGTVGEPVALAARWMGDPVESDPGEPDGPMVFTISGANTTSRTVDQKGADGWYRTSYTPTGSGDDTVTASLGDYSSGRHPIVIEPPPPPPARVSLRQGSDSSDIGTELSVTATVEGGSSEGYWDIQVRGVNAQTLSSELSANPATVSYTGRVAGQDTITATWHDYDDRVAAASSSVTHTWTRPVVPSPSLSVAVDPPGSTLVGTTVTVTVTVGASQVNGSVSASVSGANPQELRVAAGRGSYTASYRGLNAGTDTITATWTPEPVECCTVSPATASATHGWTAPRVALSAGRGALDLGETAVLAVALPDGTLGGSVQVEITSGPHAGSLKVTGSGSSFQARYTGVAPGTDTIVATLVTEEFGSFRSNPAEQAWNTPVVTLSQDSDRSIVGDTATVSAHVTGTVTGEVSFSVGGTNAGAAVARSGSLPDVTGIYSSSQDASDSITGSVTVGERTYTSAPLSHGWVTPVVVVSQDTSTSKHDDPVLLTATVSPSDVAGAVTFTVTGDGRDLSLRDDGSDGNWTASYERDAKGKDTITATLSGASGPSFTSEAIEHRWVDVLGPTVVLAPAGATTCTGARFSPTVTVTDNDDPVADTAVSLSIDPAAPGQPFTGTTDVDGHVTLPYSSSTAGIDTLTASAVVAGETTTSAAVPHSWAACELTVTIDPPGTTSTVDSTFSPTVSVRDGDGQPVADADVELQITQPDKPAVAPILRSPRTGQFGTVSIGYSRSKAGTDRIDAVVTAGDRKGRATIQHFWVDAQLQVSLAPAGTSSLTRSPFTATALVTRDRKPFPGAAVTLTAVLTADGAPKPVDVHGQVRTGPDGQASVTFTRMVAGSDTVSVDVTADGDTGRAAIVHFWTAVPGLSLTLGPAGVSTVVRTDFTVSAELLVDGDPAPEVGLTFTASMERQPDVPGSGRTDADGRAGFTYQRDTVGPDTVSVTVTLPDGRTGEASVAHLWKGPEAGGPVIPETVTPTVAVRGIPVPNGQVTVVGTGCPAGAQVGLLIDGQDVGSARARDDGSYRADVRLAGLAVGRHPLTASCPPVVAKGNIDVVVPTAATGTAAAGTTTAAAVMCFFVLLGGQLVKLSGGQPGPGS
jgi:hypothetical protein